MATQTVVNFSYNNQETFSNLNATSYQETLTTPSSSTATCTQGQFSDDANYHYVCVSTNKWRRVALGDF